MSEKKKKNFTAQEKVSILKQHFLEKKAVSNLCDEYGMHPSIFYRWQQKFFENSASAFENKKENQAVQIKKIIEEYEAKLAHKNEVFFELMEEHMRTGKKVLGETKWDMGFSQYTRYGSGFC